MTSERKRRANAENARRSTGPRTASGKAASSGNARRHGLTAPPPWDDVARHFRIVTGDGAANPDPRSPDPRARAALALAEAEAQLARCIAAERSHLLRMRERAGGGRHVSLDDVLKKAMQDNFDLDVLERMLRNTSDRWTREALKSLIRVDRDRPTELQRRHRALRRYRREAEARRRKALRRWCEVEGGQEEEGHRDPAAGHR